MSLAKRRTSLRLVSEGMNSRREVLCFQWAFCEFIRRRKDRKVESCVLKGEAAKRTEALPM